MFIPLNDANALKHIRLQYVTLAIIAANVIIWVAFATPALVSPQTVQAAVYSYGFIPAVVNGYEALPPELAIIPETTTYLTYAFFHGDFMHLAGNMLFIWVFGDNVEDSMGHFRFALFYVACAAFAAFCHALVVPQSPIPLIGASGAAAGIVGAYILLHPKIRIWILALGRLPLRIPAVFVLGAWIIFQFYMLVTDIDGNVSWAAHVGGILIGMVLITFMRRKGVYLFDRNVDVVVPELENDVSDSNDDTRSDGPWSRGPFADETASQAKRMKWGRGREK